jgi:hypothetical protein
VCQLQSNKIHHMRYDTTNKIDLLFVSIKYLQRVSLRVEYMLRFREKGRKLGMNEVFVSKQRTPRTLFKMSISESGSNRRCKYFRVSAKKNDSIRSSTESGRSTFFSEPYPYLVLQYFSML